MLLTFTSPEGMDMDLFLALYRGSSLKNCRHMYPGEPTEALALARYEGEYAAYMAGEFFRPDHYCMAEAEGNAYYSALRLYPQAEKNTFLLEALETHPDHRGRGWGSRLLKDTIAWLKENLGPVTVTAFVHKGNEASLRIHLACGFRREREYWEGPDGAVDPSHCTMVYRSTVS